MAKYIRSFHIDCCFTLPASWKEFRAAVWRLYFQLNCNCWFSSLYFLSLYSFTATLSWVSPYKIFTILYRLFFLFVVLILHLVSLCFIVSAVHFIIFLSAPHILFVLLLGVAIFFNSSPLICVNCLFPFRKVFYNSLHFSVSHTIPPVSSFTI